MRTDARNDAMKGASDAFSNEESKQKLNELVEVSGGNGYGVGGHAPD